MVGEKRHQASRLVISTHADGQAGRLLGFREITKSMEALERGDVTRKGRVWIMRETRKSGKRK